MFKELSVVALIHHSSRMNEAVKNENAGRSKYHLHGITNCAAISL
jgi:hypothetical protein